ncbi:MAG: anaerobic ribonucleoside-triphosphate reductase activating protein [Clostridia bacterium]
MKISGFYEESISNGIGWRAVLFVSGCHHNCKGCHNKEAQSFSFGEEFKKQEILENIKKNSILNGITVSGGEPLCKENIADILDFIKDVKNIKPTFNIWCYTGYTLEDLIKRNEKLTFECLNNIDVLVDGKFVLDKKNPNLKFRGSDNQRIIDMNIFRKYNKIVELNI